MKCSLSEAKAIRILELQKQNKALTVELQQLASIFQSLKVKNSTDIDISHNIQCQIQIQLMRKKLLEQSLNSLAKQKQEATKEEQKILWDMKLEQKGIQQKERELWSVLKQKQMKQAEVERLKNELRLYKSIRKGDNNIIKGSEKLKKQQQILLKTLAILKKKVESHKKYLDILEKKQAKDRECEKQEQNKCPNRGNPKPGPQKSFKYLRGNTKPMEEVEERPIVNKDKLKQFDQLTRKKNQMLLKGKK